MLGGAGFLRPPTDSTTNTNPIQVMNLPWSGGPIFCSAGREEGSNASKKLCFFFVKGWVKDYDSNCLSCFFRLTIFSKKKQSKILAISSG